MWLEAIPKGRKYNATIVTSAQLDRHKYVRHFTRKQQVRADQALLKNALLTCSTSAVHTHVRKTICFTPRVRFLLKVYVINPTWMKHFAHRHGEVSRRFKVLRHGGVVSRMDPPVGFEVIEPGRVWSAACQHGCTTGSAHSLLRERGGETDIQTFIHDPSVTVTSNLNRPERKR